MNNSIEPYSLEEVLDAYVAASQSPSREKLQEWIKRFPQYEQELIEFTVAWSQTEYFPERKGQEKDSESWIQIGMKIARQAYEQQAVENKPLEIRHKPPLVSFFQEGNRLGYSPDRLAQHLNIPMSIMRKIENRLLFVDTIPPNLTELIAQNLQRNHDEVLVYLREEPAIPQQLRLKSHQSPKTSRQSFFDAVRADTSMSEDQRTYWLSLEQKNE